MRFSVVIPAYNEEKEIGKTISHLKKQSVPREDYEIIVVDNNSKDRTGEAAKLAGADKVFVEKKQGTNFAREKGFEGSEGKIVAFCDADCEPDINWLKIIEESLNRKGVVAVSGPYDYGFTGFKRFLERFATRFVLTHLDRILYFIFRKKSGVLIGGNFAVWRWAIEKIGGLPPLAFWGDDAATAMALARHVGRVVFNPNLIVKSSPRRFEKRGLVGLELRYAWYYFKMFFSIK